MRPLTLLDLVSVWVDAPERRLDFTVVVEMSDPPSREALQSGAQSAQRRFPITHCRLDGQSWEWFDSNEALPAELAGADSQVELVRLVNSPFEVHDGWPVRQIAMRGPHGLTLATRFHHAATDGVGAWLFLAHQLEVACKLSAPVREPNWQAAPGLRRAADRTKRSRFAFHGAADPIWTRRAELTSERRWVGADLPAGAATAWARQHGLALSDFLAADFLSTLGQWNIEHGGGSDLGLWLPINIRERRSVAFGNATSRVRVYARWGANDPWLERCQSLRRQVQWSLRHGEWSVPSGRLLVRLPGFLARLLVLGYARRPGVDMASAPFSHLDRWPSAHGAVLSRLRRIEVVGQLDRKHAAGMWCTTLNGRSRATLTYDPGLLDAADATHLMDRFVANLSALSPAIPRSRTHTPASRFNQVSS